MHPIFFITVEQVRCLTDEQARELIARLCREELRKNSISEASVSWGGDQRAKDGGVDARVSINPPCGFVGFIKRDETAFQVKAEKFGPARISEEMAPHGVLRPAVKELAIKNGSYIIVSTQDSVSDSARTDRLKAMEECLSAHGLKGKVDVDFYDCRKVADWIEQYHAIATWVRSIIGQPLSGWRPYGPWAYMETDASREYLLDDRVRMFVPDREHGDDTVAAINTLRTALNKTVAIRLIGLSGVGKTRLVQALFDPRIVTECPALNRENVVYTDLADSPTPQPIAMIDALLADQADCVVIIDNCGAEVHKKLTEAASAPNCKLRLLTIEYDISDDIPEGTRCFRLEGVSHDVLIRLLRSRYPILSVNDSEKIAEFSDGNARVAFALAATAEVTGELSYLREEELFNRLFHQKKGENENLLHRAETASLLYSFNADTDASEPELVILANLAEASVVSMKRSVVELESRGLAQARGPWRAILPHAIANRLATRALTVFSPKVLAKTLVSEATFRVARSFSRRLGYLHQSENARQLATQWLREDGAYGDLGNLDSDQLQIFKNIAPIDLDATLSALERAASDPSFLSAQNLHRTDFANISRSLAYEPHHFDRAADLLVRFALADQKHEYGGITHHLESLFQCVLCGTQAKSEQKAKLLRSLLSSEDQVRNDLGFRLLKAGLKASNFSSHGNYDFGARKRGYGWSPRGEKDIRSAFLPFVDIAIEFGKSQDDRGRTARSILGNAVAELWAHGNLFEAIERAATDLHKFDGWPEGWLGTRRALLHYRDQLSGASLDRLIALEKLLAPRDLKGQIAARIVNSSNYDDDIEDFTDPGVSLSSVPFEQRYRAAQESAKSLGIAASSDIALIADMMPLLLRTNTGDRTIYFGWGVGGHALDQKKILAEARQVISDTAAEKINLFFLRGFMRGWHIAHPEDVNAFLEQASTDDVWRHWLVELEVCRPLDADSFRRLVRALQNNQTPAWQFQYLATGRATDTLSVEQILELARRVARAQGGLHFATDIVRMAIHCASEREEVYRASLADAALTFLLNLDWTIALQANWNNDNSLVEILDFALAKEGSQEKKLALLNEVMTSRRKRNRDFGLQLGPFAKHFPGPTLDAIYVPDESGSFADAISFSATYEDGERASALFEIPKGELIKWCDVSPNDRYIFAATACRLFEKNGTEGMRITELAKALVEKAPDKEAVLRTYVERFVPSSFTGLLSDSLRLRLPLFDQLNPLNDPKVEALIETLRKEFEKQLLAVQKSDEDRERKQSGSFE